MASCFGEYAVSVVDTSCASYANNGCVSPNMTPSVQNAVTSVYRITLSTAKELRAEVSWNKCQMNQGLSITFNDAAAPSFKLNTNSRLFRKLKGSRLVESNSFKIEVFWDLSLSRYQSGAEPLDGYYVLVVVDSEVGLVLGDLGAEAAERKLKEGKKIAKSSLAVRREYCSGNTLYSTKARFCDDGSEHEITIRCSGEEEWVKHPFLSIYIDKKMVIRVKRLNWNFRGNQTVFLEGLVVDLLWDVHDWFFNPFSGSAVFMFRTRSGMGSRLWLEEEEAVLQQGGDFSLLVYACRSL
uniref:Uncharacterized protein n=1 Tax=Kalanchoe fedtschenkoi TaxID=63787 RepID=A0A7N0U7C4_KALFE